MTAGNTPSTSTKLGEMFSNHVHLEQGSTSYKFNPLLCIYPFGDENDPVIDWIKVVKNYDVMNATSYNELSKDDNGHYLISEDDKIDVIVKAHDSITQFGGSNNGIFEIYVTFTGPLNTEFEGTNTFDAIIFLGVPQSLDNN